MDAGTENEQHADLEEEPVDARARQAEGLQLKNSLSISSFLPRRRCIYLFCNAMNTVYLCCCLFALFLCVSLPSICLALFVAF